MEEATLQYIWQYQLFNSKQLTTIKGEPITILERGRLNTYSGPDFLNAKIKIGDTEWVGNIEIHIDSSDWYKHRHHLNDNYGNVILHVVLRYTEKNSPSLHTLVLEDRVSSIFEENYKILKESQSFIPCDKLIHKIGEFDWLFWKEKLILQRISRKAAKIQGNKLELKNDWENILYQFLAYNLGLKSNSDPLLELAKKLPLKIILKYKNNLFQLEALFFGVAGLLKSEIKDTYYIKLQKEYNFLQKKHSLRTLKTSWNFGKIRPASFPTIRIAQLVAIVHHTDKLFSKIIKTNSTKEIHKILSCETSKYWHTHYTFGKESKYKQKKLGKSKINSIIINTILPIKVLLLQKEQSEKIEDSIIILKQISSERNKIVDGYQNLGLEIKNSYDSQSVIELYNEYCTKKRCLECRIGYKLLKGN